MTRRFKLRIHRYSRVAHECTLEVSLYESDLTKVRSDADFYNLLLEKAIKKVTAPDAWQAVPIPLTPEYVIEQTKEIM